MTIGVVIPCRDEATRITEVLDALLAQDRLPDDVVVVDDGSSDGTGTVVEEWRRRHERLPVRVVPGCGRGIAAAINTGVAAIGADVIVRLDGHCRPEPDYVRRTSTVATDAGVGVAGGVWIVKPGASSLQAQAIALAVSHRIGSGGAAYRHAVAVPEGKASLLSVDTVPFGCFRRALWVALGGFDEDLRTNEDYDFNFRARQQGLTVVLDLATRCTYYARPTVWSLARQYGRYGWWKARMLRRHPESIRWRQLVPAVLVPALVTAALGTIVFGGPIWPSLLVVYPSVVLVAAFHAAATFRAWRATGWFLAIFPAIHLAWSGGFLVSLLAMATGAGDARGAGGTRAPDTA